MSQCMYEEGRGQDHLTLSIYVVLLTDIRRHCNNDMLFTFFHHFHIFHFPTMR